MRGSDCSAVALSAPSSPSAATSAENARGVCTHTVRSSSGYSARSGVKRREVMSVLIIIRSVVLNLLLLQLVTVFQVRLVFELESTLFDTLL
jgi:hypothetical protein